MPGYKVVARILKADGTVTAETYVTGPFWDHRLAEEAAAGMAVSGKWADIQITGS